MSALDLIIFFGGIGLFLFGIKIMGQGLEMSSGNRLKNMLNKVTSNKYLAVLAGVVITALIQSSSATTVMVVGFVNAGLINLVQATGVIMGANIGTTVTSVLVTLKLSDVAPIFIFIGTVMIVFFKKKSVNHIGDIIAGFGMLFVGMTTMSSAVSGLKNSPVFIDFLTNNSNPVIGLLAGIVFTAVIQSSSASIGVLQALAMDGLIPIRFAVFVLYGQNIGTCITTVLSSSGGNKNSKRAAAIHLMFNIFGTVFFVLISLFTPYISILERISSETAVQISASHIIFNVVSTLILFPFSKVMVRLACKIVPDIPDKQEDELRLKYLDERILSAPPFAVYQASLEVKRMGELAKKNFLLSSESFLKSDLSYRDEIIKNEETVNYLNHSITTYLVRINNLDISYRDSEYIGRMFHALNDIERIGDHAINLLEATVYRQENNPKISREGIKEIEEMTANVSKLLDMSFSSFYEQNLSYSEGKKIVILEEHIDDLHDKANENHINRMRENKCDTVAGPLFVNTVTDFERVADHAINIAFTVPNSPEIVI